MTEDELTLLIKQLDTDGLETVMDIGAQSDSFGQDGFVRIKEQTVIVQDPQDGGRPPLIRAVSPVRLFVNGTPVEGDAAVTSADRIQWEFEERPLFEIKVTPDRLRADLLLHDRERYAWKLEDVEPTKEAMLRMVEDRTMVLESVRLTDIVAELKQAGIAIQLDIAAIQRELEHPTNQPVTVALGKPAVSGQDAGLELYFAQQVESHFFEVGGAVDFRNHLQIPSVKRGEVIAKIIPPVQGVPGFDIYGNVLLPPPPKDVIVVVKPSVEQTPEGEIVALKEGRPRITGDKIKTFDISTSYVVPGNVDIQTGNIVFSGDVIVYGDVTDNMIIESLGNVYVYGSVYNATITGTGSIYIRENVMGSRLYSGYFGVMFNRLYHSSRQLSEQIEKLLAACQLLDQALAAKRQQPTRFGQIVVLLMENKFREIPVTIKELLLVVANIQHLIRGQYQKLKEMSEMFLQTANLLQTASYSLLQSYLAMLQETHQEVARMQEETVEIRINQCHNSELKSNGDIVIQREGVLLSDLYSSGDILFTNDLSVCRGARLTAGGSIWAKIIGGETGASTVLKAARQVSVRKMYAGRICIGNYCTDIFERVEDRIFDARTFRPHV